MILDKFIKVKNLEEWAKKCDWLLVQINPSVLDKESAMWIYLTPMGKTLKFNVNYKTGVAYIYSEQ